MFRISFEKCPGSENYKLIDKMYPLFLELGKDTCLTTCSTWGIMLLPRPHYIFPRHKLSEGEKSPLGKHSKKRIITTNPSFKRAPPYRASVLLLQTCSMLPCVKREDLWMDEPWRCFTSWFATSLPCLTSDMANLSFVFITEYFSTKLSTWGNRN